MAKQLTLDMAGGFCSELFPRLRSLLEFPGIRKGLRLVSTRKNTQRYRDSVDFMFCESLPTWRNRCFAYYRNDGPGLRAYSEATPSKLKEWDTMLYKAAAEAHMVTQGFQVMAWNSFNLHLDRMDTQRQPDPAVVVRQQGWCGFCQESLEFTGQDECPRCHSPKGVGV